MVSIENITLIGGVPFTENYKQRLEEISIKAKSVIGLVAFWTISYDDLPSFINLLKDQNSFMCVDPTNPTDIEILFDLGQDNCNLNVYSYQVYAFESTDGLLHSKVMLFDIDEEYAELWIGSHNLTKRAINGINVEHSLIIKLKKNTELYKEIRDQILLIRTKYCVSIKDYVPPELLPEDVLIIYGERMDELQSEGLIMILYEDMSEAIKYFERDFYVLAIEVSNNSKYLYKVRLHQSGELNNSVFRSTDIQFGRRRYGEKAYGTETFLKLEDEIHDYQIKKYRYFNNISVLNMITRFEVMNVEKDLDRFKIDYNLFAGIEAINIKKHIGLHKKLLKVKDKAITSKSNHNALKEYYDAIQESREVAGSMAGPKRTLKALKKMIVRIRQ
jgi:hypothetical protein